MLFIKRQFMKQHSPSHLNLNVIKLRKIFFNLFPACRREVEQRSAFGVSQLCEEYLRQYRSYSLLTRSLLRLTTLSFASKKEGKTM